MTKESGQDLADPWLDVMCLRLTGQGGFYGDGRALCHVYLTAWHQPCVSSWLWGRSPNPKRRCLKTIGLSPILLTFGGPQWLNLEVGRQVSRMWHPNRESEKWQPSVQWTHTRQNPLGLVYLYLSKRLACMLCFFCCHLLVGFRGRIFGKTNVRSFAIGTRFNGNCILERFLP